MKLSTELDFINTTLLSLREYVMETYTRRREITISTKTSPSDLLTEADVEVQRRIGVEVERQWPKDVLVGEESGMENPPDDPSTRAWVVDPIDGTANFVKGMLSVFGVSIGLVQNDQAIAGGVMIPSTGEIYLAALGKGAWLNGQRLSVSTVTAVDHARIEVEMGYPSCRERILTSGHELLMKAGNIRCMGTAVIGLCGVACGENDAYVHAWLKPWDFAACKIIIEEAGGRVTDYHGRPITVFGPHDGFLASNGHIHATLSKLLSGE